MKDRDINTDARSFLGLRPHDGPENISRGDGYFNEDCKQHWGRAAWDKACKEALGQYEEDPCDNDSCPLCGRSD